MVLEMKKKIDLDRIGLELFFSFLVARIRVGSCGNLGLSLEGYADEDIYCIVRPEMTERIRWMGVLIHLFILFLHRIEYG